jgi:beta-phosphoglucomutase-like phosphatase (HAD superfamily)
MSVAALPTPTPESTLEKHLSELSESGKKFGLLFDCDGTLIDTMPMYYASWELTLAELKLPPLPPARFYSLGGMPVHGIFEMLLREAGKQDEITLEQCEETKRRHHTELVAKGLAVAPGIKCVIDIARKYKSLNVPMAVASSGWRDHVLNYLKQEDCLDLFDVVVTGDDSEIGAGKPAPDIFLLAAKRLGVPACDCVGFEDAPLGMQSLEAARVKYACDVTKFHEYPRNVEARAAAAAASN